MQAAKLRYLNAIGIESWVRRSSPEAVSSLREADEASVAADAGVDTGVPPSEPVAAVRSLLDAEPGAAPASVSPSELPRQAEAESRPAKAQRPSQPPLQAQATPEFRLLLLYLGGSVLLVDEHLLDPGALQSEQAHLLGDVLRSARLLVHGDASGSIERQIFYWPQVDDASLDQGLPRALEALAYHVRTRLEGGEGPLLHVTPKSEPEAGSGSAIARDSIAELGAVELGLKVLEVSAELLDLQAPRRVRAQIWAELCTLDESSGNAAPGNTAS